MSAELLANLKEAFNTRCIHQDHSMHYGGYMRYSNLPIGSQTNLDLQGRISSAAYFKNFPHHVAPVAHGPINDGLRRNKHRLEALTCRQLPKRQLPTQVHRSSLLEWLSAPVSVFHYAKTLLAKEKSNDRNGLHQTRNYGTTRVTIMWIY